MRRMRYVLAVLGGGCLWGFMGMFRRFMGDAGFSSYGVVFIRCGVAAICFGLTLIITNRSGFIVHPKDIWCFAGSGLAALLLFTVCYFQAISLISLSAAAILLYTAPSFVIIMSAVFFHEKITKKKIAAILLAFFGCGLVSGIGGDLKLNTAGVIYGLSSGIGYALYSIFGKCAIKRGYSSNTINFYSCLLASAGAAFFCGPARTVTLIFTSGETVILCLLLGLISCYFPYLLYTYGLTGLEAGTASVIASVEPVVATIVGAGMFHEALSLTGTLGSIMVLAGIVVVNMEKKTNKNKVQ